MVRNVFAPARDTLPGLAVIIAISTFASGNVASPAQPHLSRRGVLSGLNGPLANQCSMVRRGVYRADPLQLRSANRTRTNCADINYLGRELPAAVGAIGVPTD